MTALKIHGGTIPPFQGATYYTAYREQVSEALNQWIPASGAFATGIDFDAAPRSTSNTLAPNPAYDSGGASNDAAYQAMADAVDLGMLKPEQHP
jgi:lysophospholipase L1-like esterase